MQPNSNQQSISSPSSLPAVPGLTPSAAAMPAGQPAPGFTSSPADPMAAEAAPIAPDFDAGVERHGVAQAKQVIAQYGNDPYKLAAAFGQLKSGYLASQYHITPNQAGK